jgi:hypothetical protein
MVIFWKRQIVFTNCCWQRCDSYQSGTRPIAFVLLLCHTTFVVEEFSTLTSHTPNVMKLFASKFYQTLVFNVATICAIVVGLYQFSVRAYNENNGNEKVRKVIQTVLRFINAIVTQLLAVVDTDVPVVKVAQKTTKRR